MGWFAWGLASVEAAPDWVLETPHEFVALGRFRVGSQGSDCVVVDKANGLARLGFREGDGFVWSEQAIGMSGLTGFAVLRGGEVDRAVATSVAWNALQHVTPGNQPRTRSSPVPGPKMLARYAVGQEQGAPIEGVVAFSEIAGTPVEDRVGAWAEDGRWLFEGLVVGRVRSAQTLALGPAPAVPVVVVEHSDRLRISRPGVDGAGLEGFEIAGPNTAGFAWTAANEAVVMVGDGEAVLWRHRLSGNDVGGGFRVASGVAESASVALPDTVVGLDIVPYLDAALPDPGHLLVLRFASSPEIARLYRLTGSPAVAVEVGILEVPAGESYLGVLSTGSDFLVVSGSDGRVGSWRRYAQPAPGEIPVPVGAGEVPGTPVRASHPNLFRFDRDPVLRPEALLLGSERRHDWTGVTEMGAIGEIDGGSSAGLGSPSPLDLSALNANGGGVWVGNQLLPEASVVGLGPTAGLVRSAVRFTPSPGAYDRLRAGQTFPVQIRGTLSVPGVVRYRRAGESEWRALESGETVELRADEVLTAYVEDAGTGERSTLAVGEYRFGPLPALEPVGSEDRDGDGLADAWERAFDVDDPESDDDGDGASAASEFRAGTDPWDPMSRPPGDIEAPVLSVARLEDGQLRLRWEGQPGGQLLEVSDDLQAWSPVEPQPVGNEWSAVLEGTGRFFRLRQR